MLRPFSNYLVTVISDLSQEIGLLQTAITLVADRFLPRANAQGGCDYFCYNYTCLITQGCPTRGEVAQVWSVSLYCQEPFCYYPQGVCC